MKILLVDLYKLIYRITNNSVLSIVVSVAYMSFLTIVAFYGLSQLWPQARGLQVLFRLPVAAVTFVVLCLLCVWAMMPLKNIKKEKKKPIGYWGLIMYTVLAIIIYAYTRYSNILFQ